MDQRRNKLLFVVNPISGRNDKSQLEKDLEEFSKSYNLDHQVFITSEKENLENLKNLIHQFDPQIVIAAGGDGTCNMVAQVIVHTDKIMGILPLGSANGLATELGIPKNLPDSLNLLVSGDVKILDTILINQKLCLHISDIGLNARVIKRFDEDEMRGMYGYIKHFFKEIWGARPLSFHLIAPDGKRIKKKAHVVAIANASRYGTGAIINPHGLMDDGEFELIIVKPYPFFALFSIAAAVFMGYPDKNKYIEIRSYKRIIIQKNKKQPLHIDGEIIDDAEIVEAFIDPASLRVITPKAIG